MNKIIVISGKQYSGKDTLAKILLEKMPEYKRVGIGDSIKLRFGKENNLTFEQIEKDKHIYREKLIELGNWGRTQDKHYWLQVLSDMDKIIVPDVRMVDELNFFKNKNAFLVRVNSSLQNRSKRGVIIKADDDTETALDNYTNWNIIVENNSSYEELKKQADNVVDLFLKHIKS